MEKEKFKISIIDFMPFNGQFKVGEDINGTPVHYGDIVKYNNESNWFVTYRYGKTLLKQVGMMAMIGSLDFDKGDFSKVEKMNVFGAGTDWLIIGYTDEPFWEQVKHVVEPNH